MPFVGSVEGKMAFGRPSAPKGSVGGSLLFNGAANFADAISFGDDQVDKKLLESFSKVKGKKVIFKL